MRTGVIMELRQGRAVVLDGSGGFREIAARPQWRRGDVVPLPAAGAHRLRQLGLAACLAVVLAGAGGWLWLTPAALVSLDVNPSVELSVNRFDRVIGVRAMNGQGAALLEAGPVKGLETGEALTALLGSAYLAPYLEGDYGLTLTVQAPDSDRAARLLERADAAAAACAGPGTPVSCHGVDRDLVEAAHEHGVTAGKYLALLDLQAADPAIDIQAYAHCGIEEIEAQTARCHAAADDPEPAPGEGRGAGHGHHGH